MRLRNKALAIIIGLLTVAVTVVGQSEGLRPVKRGAKYGYVNEQGRMVITAKYAIAMEFGEGLAYVAESPDRHGSWKHGFIDENGRWVAYLDGKSFRRLLAEGYGEEHDVVVFKEGFVELPSYNSTGGKDFETSSVWMNRQQMMDLVEKYGKETPIRPTSRVFYTKVMKGEGHVIGLCAKANNAKGPNGVIAFDEKEKRPVTTIQAGEENQWFGSFGIMRYTGDTYLVYTEREKRVRYFDEVTVMETREGDLVFIAKEMSGAYVLYDDKIEQVGDESWESVGEFMREHGSYMVRETADYMTEYTELRSRRMMEFRTMEELEGYYLNAKGYPDGSKLPVCTTAKGDVTQEVRLHTRCGAVMITAYTAESGEAVLMDFTTNSRVKVKLPLTVNASGRDGEDGEAGSDGASGRPKLTYRENNMTKTEAGTCGEAGGNGKEGKRGEDGATLLVLMDNEIEEGMVTFVTEGGRGGKGGQGGKGGIHGNGSPCSGKAKDGVAGKDGAAGKRGSVKVVKF